MYPNMAADDASQEHAKARDASLSRPPSKKRKVESMATSKNAKSFSYYSASNASTSREGRG